MPLEMLPDAINEHAAPTGIDQVLIYLVDVRRRVLRQLTASGAVGPEDGEPEELKVEGTVPGRAYQYGEVLPAAPAEPGRHQRWVPLLNGTERIGLLRVTTAVDDARAREDMKLLAALVALIVVSKRAFSDTFARLVGSEAMTIAAEMQWRLMPPTTYADGRVAISAVMEPAFDISGDAYDYATDGPMVRLAVFDAMGHDTAAGLAANLALGACRNARRRRADLVRTGERVDEALIEQFQGDHYATGILADLDTRSGELRWVSFGHHPPLIIRGGRWTTHLRCPPGLPLGMGLGLGATLCREQLQPGDRLVFYTDGITEARRPGGREFGLTRFVDFLIRRHADGLPVPETLRRLVGAVMAHHDGRLQDDATVLLCEWLGPVPGPTDQAAALMGVPAT
ncbi:PP2C family protein-serine/threonine phosphatase [Streptomyces javensis]|uniref:PP2C family protein-serine/threonine phosphatase n=1 Tax=Streptomyces javensis TaxID=114698 RepID=UPI003F4D486E